MFYVGRTCHLGWVILYIGYEEFDPVKALHSRVVGKLFSLEQWLKRKSWLQCQHLCIPIYDITNIKLIITILAMRGWWWWWLEKGGCYGPWEASYDAEESLEYEFVRFCWRILEKMAGRGEWYGHWEHLMMLREA